VYKVGATIKASGGEYYSTFMVEPGPSGYQNLRPLHHQAVASPSRSERRRVPFVVGLPAVRDIDAPDAGGIVFRPRARLAILREDARYSKFSQIALP